MCNSAQTSSMPGRTASSSARISSMPEVFKSALRVAVHLAPVVRHLLMHVQLLDVQALGNRNRHALVLVHQGHRQIEGVAQ